MATKKGPNFERDICKALSVWWSSGVRDDVFWRTPGSGARATNRAKLGLRTHDSYGDVAAIHPKGKILTDQFVISLKRGYTSKSKNLRSLDITDLLDCPAHLKTNPLLYDWWLELENDIAKSGRPKEGIIICRRDRRNSIIIMSRKVFKMIEDKKPCLHPIYNAGCWLQYKGLNLQITQLNHFFYWCDPKLLGAKFFLRKVGEKLHPDYIKPGPFPQMLADYHAAFKNAVCVI